MELPRRRRGNPGKLTPERVTQICELIKKGMSRTAAARRSGISDTTLGSWLKKGREQETGDYRYFLRRVLEAEATLQEQCVDVMQDLLGSGTPPGVRLGAAKFMLEKRSPEDFGSKTEVRHAGHDGGPIEISAKVEVVPLFSDIQIAQMTPEQLQAALAGAQTRLLEAPDVIDESELVEEELGPLGEPLGS